MGVSLGVKPNDAPPSHHLRPVIFALCAAAFVLAWLPRLHWGFWHDEAATYWMASAGWREAIRRTIAWPGQSILYSVLQSFFVSKGFWEEPLLRLPSLAAMGVAAWQLTRIAELLFGRSARALVIVPFVCAPEIVTLGASARPYALALAASLASFRYLLEWQETQNKSSIAKYLVASLLTLYLHYLFAFIFVIQSAYLLFCRLIGRKVPFSLPLAAAILLPASLLPLLVAVPATKHYANVGHVVPPTISQLAEVSFPPALLLATALGVLLLLISARNLRWRAVGLRPEIVFLLVIWAILGPVAFFTITRLFGFSVFASRYLLFALPPILLFIAWIVAGLERREWRILMLLAIFAGTVLNPGNLFVGFRNSSISWREPLRFIQKESAAELPPVFVASGGAESAWTSWKEQDPRNSFLFPALTAYPIRNPKIPLPRELDQDAKDSIRARLLDNDRYLLLAESDSELGPWMSRYMGQLGFRVESSAVNDFVVLEFRRLKPAD